MKVVWTEQAWRKLADIERFVALDSPGAAVALVDQLVALGESLESCPQRGRKVPEIDNQDIREIIAGNYRLIYRVAEEAVEILTVFERHQLLRLEGQEG